MEGNVDSSPQGRDADGNVLMSLDELKENMFQSIRDNGTVEHIRAQLRRRFIEKLQQQCRSNNERDDGENDASRVNRGVETSTTDEKLVHGLVAEYLVTKGLENTLAVFVPEIGGSKNQVDSATILEEMERTNTGRSLLLVLVQELVRRFQLATMDSGTQTAMDCFDHRIVLENQLRRVENTYLAECAAQKLEPQKSLEERMVQYQREYDEICDKRLQEELERYKSTEVALVRAEERKRFDQEVDNLRASLLQEHHNKQARLQERERELELVFVGRRTELETSLFETRQSLFKDMERLRVKEAELQVKVESDFRHFASETQRFQLWEESVSTQEDNLKGIISQAMREKERAWQIERSKALQDIQIKQDELADRQQSLATEAGTLKTLKTQVSGLQQEVAALETALSKSGDDLRVAHNSTVQHEKDRLRLEERVADLELQLGEQKNTLNDSSAVNARLEINRSLINDELSRYKQKNTEIKEQMKLAAGDVKALQQQVLNMKLDEANAIVAERRKFMQLMDEERERFHWKENELLAQVRDLQSRLAESQAQAEKYQSQYEDEKVHVEALRHDVASLNSLLTQAQASINAKHGVPRDSGSFRAQRSVVNSDAFDSGGYGTSDSQVRRSERTFMMKMMEMMASVQNERVVNRDDSLDDRSKNVIPTRDGGTARNKLGLVTDQSTSVLAAQELDEDQQEAKRIKEDQDRIERELLEQREYEKKKQTRIEQQERELAEQQKLFDEKLVRMRQERVEEEEWIEEQRKRKQTEAEATLQEELARQRTAIQDAADLHKKIAEQHLADEQRRLQEEEAYREKRLAEERNLDEEIEAKRQQRQREEEQVAKQQQEREAEEERLKVERESFEERKRIQLEKEQAEASQAAMLKEEEARYEHDTVLRLADETRMRDQDKNADITDAKAVAEESSWQEFSREDGDANLDTSESQPESSVVEVFSTASKESLTSDKAEENLTGDLSPHSDIPDPNDLVTDADSVKATQGDEVASIPIVEPESPAKTPEKVEQERQRTTEEAKKEEDENVIDVYRQRVLARKAAEKQRQLEIEAAENDRKAREEQQVRQQFLGDVSDSDHELELSGGSFAESSAASNSDSF